MMFKNDCSISLLLVTVFALLLITTAAFSTNALTLERVRLVDSSVEIQGTPRTFFFRGDVPDWDSDNTHFTPNGNASFRFDRLMQFFAIRLVEQGIIMPPPPYYIVDFNLLSNTSQQQRNAIEAEEEYFKQNPTRGQTVNWPIHGTPIDPRNLSQAQRDEYFSNYSWETLLDKNDQLPTLVDVLHQLVHSPVKNVRRGSMPTNATLFVYVHCIGGEDRTGEVSGAYAMRHLGWSAPTVFEWDTKIAGRWIGRGERSLMQWYCFWLERRRRWSRNAVVGVRLSCDKMYPPS